MIQNTAPPMRSMRWWNLAKSRCSQVIRQYDQTTTKPRPNSDQTTTQLCQLSLTHHWYGLSAPTISFNFQLQLFGIIPCSSFPGAYKLVYCEPILYAVAFSTADISIQRFFLHPSDYPRQRFLSTFNCNCLGSSLAVLSLEPTNWFIVSPSFMR